MKKYLSLFLIFIIIFGVLSGCKDEKINLTDLNDYNVNGPVEQVGEVPEEFKNIVDNNLFKGVTAYDGGLLKTKILSSENADAVVHEVRMIDKYGKDIAVYNVTAPDTYYVTTLTATDDGGFLFVLGFRDRAIKEGVWASDKGFASRVIKCDKNGELQFDTALKNIESYALGYCYEKNGKFYLFGTRYKYETKKMPSNAYITVIDKNGEVLKEKSIGGTDYDDLLSVQRVKDGFDLLIRAQSDDGDFKGSNSGGYGVEWIVTINDNLDIVDKKKYENALWPEKMGENDGEDIYSDHAYFKDFDAGNPNAFIDYGDFYLIVSNNSTGVYENTPLYISAVWYYTETVYSAYDYDGKLIFRASKDSSPDFDDWVKKLENS